MLLMKWRDSYSVGVEKFDEEHKILLDLINEMFLIVRDKRSVDHLSLTINKLIQYTQEHFDDEERGMEEVGYPELGEHKILHGKLLKEVTVYKKRIDSGDQKAVQDLYLFLRDWLMTHIIEDDMKYSSYFTETVPV